MIVIIRNNFVSLRMANQKEFKIKESVTELKSSLNLCKRLKEEKRLKMLILLKNNTFKRRQALAEYLGVSKRVLNNWVNMYIKDGIKSFTSDRQRNKTSKLDGSIIAKAIETRVSNPKTGFLSYVDAQQWIRKEFGEDIKYHTLRNFMIAKFGTKVKSPRRSHVKKDPEASALFLNVTNHP